MPERKTAVLDARSAASGRYASPSRAMAFGFMTAMLLAGGLYFTFKDEFIAKRSIAIPPLAPAFPVGVPPNSAKPQTK